MNIQYKNITIRTADSNDASTLCQWWNDGTIMEHAGFPNGLGTTEEEIQKQLSSQSDERGLCLIIELDKKPVGEMSYSNLGNEVSELGIKICDIKKQNKGLGRILLSMLIHTLFEEYGYKKIILDTNLKNKRAQYVYEMLGFTKVKVETDGWKNQLGELQSTVHYELTPKDFITWMN